VRRPERREQRRGDQKTRERGWDDIESSAIRTFLDCSLVAMGTNMV